MESKMTGGYPDPASMLAIFAARGIELVTESNSNFMEDYYKTYWGILNALDFVISLSVYPASPTTFNVRSGSYVFNGATKTFTAGAAIDPTDNDTTYIWMNPGNTIGSAIDGTGWPATEHIKLAEIDVDSVGKITAVRELRGKSFLQYRPAEMFTLKATLVAGSTVQIHNADALLSFEIIDAWSIAKSANAGTWKLTDGTNDITDAVAVTATDKKIDRAGTIDDAYSVVPVAGSLSVVGDGSLADVEVRITCVRIA